MIDYTKWPRKKISTKSLKLDSFNPRLSGFGNKEPNQTQILEYMVEYENVLDLARKISKLGFLPNNEPIVYKKDNRYIVLEGNRRTTACKLLEDPDLLNKSNKSKMFKTLSNSINPALVKQLTVIVAPSREAADVLIVNIHTQGSPVEKWDKTKQDRFFHNRFKDGETIDQMAHKFNLPKSAVKDSISRHNIFNEFLDLELPQEEKSSLEDETKFTMTTVERFYKSKIGKDFLGININNEGKIEHSLPKIEYRKRLAKVASDVINKVLTSRSYGDEALQKKYLNSLKESNKFDLSIALSKKYEAEYESLSDSEEEEIIENNATDKNTSEKNRSTIAPNHKLVPAIAHSWRTGNVRIDKIFQELKEGDLNKQFNAIAILFRSYLDMVVYQFLQKHEAVHELIKHEQQKINLENNKKIDRVKSFITSLDIAEESINLNDLTKALNIKTGVGKDWVPSLRQMLIYLSTNENLLPDAKFRQALSSYLKGNDAYLGHHDFNLLVHNEYYMKGKKELKDTWDHLFPILNYINTENLKR